MTRQPFEAWLMTTYLEKKAFMQTANEIQAAQKRAMRKR